MPAFWDRWFGSKKPETFSLSLADYAENYLIVFESGSHDEQTRHATKLYEAANDSARYAGAADFLELMERADVMALTEAAAYARARFDEMGTVTEGKYWLSSYACTHLMILNRVGSLNDVPQVKLTAENAVRLYSAEYARQEMS